MEPLLQLVTVLLSPRATAFIMEVLVVEDVRLAAVLVVHLVLLQSEVTLDSNHEAAHTRTHTDRHRHTQTQTHTHTSTYTNTQTYTNTCTHTHTDTHTHTHQYQNTIL